jgi:hypothetical protein
LEGGKKKLKSSKIRFGLKKMYTNMIMQFRKGKLKIVLRLIHYLRGFNPNTSEIINPL